jgi:predicted nucleic acid-binding protein
VLTLLDTTVLIDYLRGAPASERVEALLDRGDIACTTAINVEEIVRGVRPKERKHATELLEGLLIVPLGAREGWRAGTWRRDFSAEGITLSQADCLIAAAALTADAILATGNPKDFPMTEVTVEHWPVGG